MSRPTKRNLKRWDATDEAQFNLFLHPNLKSVSNYNPIPPVGRTLDSFKQVLATADPNLGIGYDLEFNGDKPTIIGIATLSEAASLRWTSELGRMVVDSGLPLVGHSIHGAEKDKTQKALGIEIPVERFDDSLLAHYLVAADLTKSPDKKEAEEEGGSGAGGFLNLWVASSLHMDWPNWKQCRQNGCVGPCALHDPFGYNGTDAAASLHIIQSCFADMRRKNIPHSLYRELMELGDICERMQQQGIKVDVNWANSLDNRLAETKARLYPEDTRPYNPRSDKQIIEYFSGLGLTLDKTDKKTIETVLDKACSRHGVDSLVLNSLFDDNDVPEYLNAISKYPQHIQELHKLRSYKDRGSGVDKWFGDKYLDKHNLVHPRWLITGTCTGRLASSKPNFQNVKAPRGWGKEVRKAVIPRDPSLCLAGADFSQLELRMCLYLAGVDPYDIGADAFLYVVELAGDKLNDASSRLGMKPRDVAKSVAHASSYGEGVKVLFAKDLDNPRIKREIAAGALAVYKDWSFRGGVIAFTGANLAERLFGSRSLEHRRAALEISEGIYFTRFPMLRDWHRKVSAEIEDKRAVQSPTGRYLELYGTDEEDLKSAWSFLGQGTSADHVQGVMLRYWRELRMLPYSQIHDELIFELPAAWSDKKVLDTLMLMEEETWRLANFRAPVKCKRGNTWGDCKELAR